MNIEKIEKGPEKVGIISDISFVLVILLTIVAGILTARIIIDLITVKPEQASTRAFAETIGKTLAYVIFIMGAIIYLYVKNILQDEFVTTIE